MGSYHVRGNLLNKERFLALLPPSKKKPFAATTGKIHLNQLVEGKGEVKIAKWNSHNSFAFLYLIVAVTAGASTPDASSAAGTWPNVSSHLGATVGGSILLGSLSNPDAGLQSRSMVDYNLDGLLGYKLNQWLLGVALNYRWQDQLTSLSNAGGTNLMGNGWLFGLGAKYHSNPAWAITGTLALIGNYHFSHQTYVSEDDGLSGPLAIGVKFQYFFFKNTPLSTDADFRWIHFSTLRITSTDYSAATSSALAGVGLSWHFGDRELTPGGLQGGKSEVKQVALPVSSNPPEPENSTIEQQFSQFSNVRKTESGLMLNLDGDLSFASGSAELSTKARDIIKSFGQILLRYPNQKVSVEGHTDSSGNASKNQILSQMRAESVKEALLDEGLNAENIVAKGFGQDRPVADNKTVDGRKINRRVEIHLDIQQPVVKTGAIQ